MYVLTIILFIISPIGLVITSQVLAFKAEQKSYDDKKKVIDEKVIDEKVIDEKVIDELAQKYDNEGTFGPINLQNSTNIQFYAEEKMEKLNILEKPELGKKNFIFIFFKRCSYLAYEFFIQLVNFQF